MQRLLHDRPAAWADPPAQTDGAPSGVASPGRYAKPGRGAPARPVDRWAQRSFQKRLLIKLGPRKTSAHRDRDVADDRSQNPATGHNTSMRSRIRQERQ